MVNNLVRIVYILLALMVPGGFVFLAIAWLGRKLFRRLEITRFSHAPLRDVFGNQIGLMALSPAQTEAQARKSYPVRYWLTTTLPKASRKPVAAFRARFWPQPPPEAPELILERPGRLGTQDPTHVND